jgi:hypothetical protein
MRLIPAYYRRNRRIHALAQVRIGKRFLYKKYAAIKHGFA